jgi:small-conductance mechanosensitive channel
MTAILQSLLTPALIAAVSSSVLFGIRAVALRVVHRWADRTKTKLDDAVFAALRTPSIFWVVAIGIYIGVTFSDLPQKQAALVGTTIHILVILSITIAAANLSGDVFRNYVQRLDLAIPATGLADGIVKGAIYIIGFLIVLSLLGISIAPLLTALGVGGLAVALALQDTLANLFAGIHILVERSIRVGDFVRLETGQEGYVQDITWRTTRVRMLPNNMVVIPNRKLAQSVVTNYYLPDRAMAVQIPVGVSYDQDPETVERMLIEEAQKAAAEVPGMLADPAPAVRLAGFGESSIDFVIVCTVREFSDQYPVQSEVRKRVFKRFRAGGIEIPYPQRTVHVREEKP